MQVLLTTCGSWYLPQTARAFQERKALGGLWISEKNSTNIPATQYRRCWPYHLALKPFYHWVPQIWFERTFYALSPIWQAWLRSRLRSGSCPRFDVVQAIMGFATDAFDHADRTGALKVIDCANSHPTTLRGFWQRECDLWCPGERLPLPDWFFARMNRELERADVILCPSNFVRDTMLLNGLSPARCFVSPFGADTTIFRPRPAVPDRPRFISVGTICLRKGYQYLFRAFERVKKNLPEAELICVGDYKCDFRREMPRWHGSFVHYSGLSHRDLADLLQTCTAFVFPSVEEGLARSVIEAMAAGLPILASHESGATTVVQDGVEGLLIRARDPEQIAGAMLRVARDRNLNERLGRAAACRAAGNTWQDYGDRLLAEYGRHLTRRAAPSST